MVVGPHIPAVGMQGNVAQTERSLRGIEAGELPEDLQRLEVVGRRRVNRSVVEIEGANEDAGASYQVLATLSPDANGNASYTDIGRAAFFRAVLSTAGNIMPRVIAHR